MKKIVWDLFGGGQNSVYNTLKENKLLDKFEVLTFDVTEPTRENHYKIDLSQDNIIEIFKKFPKPDVIISSPLCQSFSQILQIKGGGTCFWKLNKDGTKLIERTIEEFNDLKAGFTKHLDGQKQLKIKRLGEKCINNSIELIKYFKPKYFYIENPASSLIWRYIRLNRKDFYNEELFFNKTRYGNYGWIMPKPTIFLSNIKLNLKNEKFEKAYYCENNKCYLREEVKKELEKNFNLQEVVNESKQKTGLEWRFFKETRIKNKKLTEQISESGVASFIPHSLILEIFKNFIE